MKKIFFVINVVFLCLVHVKSWAVECYQGYSTTCREWSPDVKDACGEGCSYHYDANTKTLTIVAEGENATIARGAFMPYSYQTTVKRTFPSEDGDIEVENVVIDGNFKTIGHYAFLGLGASISGKDGVISAEKISREVFLGNTITSDIIVDKLMTNSNLLNQTQLANNVKIYCIEKDTAECRQYIIDSCSENGCRDHDTALLSDDALFAKTTQGCVKPAANSKCSKCKNGLLEKEGVCISAANGCGENWKDMGGWCNRIRYTPAEAAQYLKDTDNEIIMTFKVNR